MGNSLRTCYIGLKSLDAAGRAKVEELVFRASTTPSYDIHNDEYIVRTSLTPEEFLALPWPDGCTFRDQSVPAS